MTLTPPVTTVGTYAANDVATFWIGSDGKVKRYWFANDVYKRKLDSPTARPSEVYGKDATR